MTSESTRETRRKLIKTLGVGTGGLIGVAAGGLIVGGAGGYFGRAPEVSSLQGQVDSVTKINSNLMTQLDTLTKARDGLQSQVSSLNGQISGLNGQISTLQGQVGDLTSKSLLNTVELKNSGDRYTAWVAFSKANTVDGVDHRVAMQGVVRFNPDKHTVEGGGSFGHFDNAPPAPKPVISSGKWEAIEFVSYLRKDPPGIYGLIEASILEMKINLLPNFGLNAGKIIPATLRPVCNVGALGVAGNVGEPEGYTLTIPDTPFAADGAAGPFKPLVPALGLTHISVVGPVS